MSDNRSNYFYRHLVSLRMHFVLNKTPLYNLVKLVHTLFSV